MRTKLHIIAATKVISTDFKDEICQLQRLSGGMRQGDKTLKLFIDRSPLPQNKQKGTDFTMCTKKLYITSMRVVLIFSFYKECYLQTGRFVIWKSALFIFSAPSDVNMYTAQKIKGSTHVVVNCNYNNPYQFLY